MIPRNRTALTLVAAAAFLAPTGAAAGQGGKAQKVTATWYSGALHKEQGTGLNVSGGDIRFRGKLGEGIVIYKTKPLTSPNETFRAPRFAIYLTRGTFKGTGQATFVAAADDNDRIEDGTFKLKGTGAYRGRTMTGTWAGDSPDGVFKLNVAATIR